jgi:outer membrane protein insertion porin family
MVGGIDLFAKIMEPTQYSSYSTETIGTNLRLGFALTEEIRLTLRYSIYSQKVELSPNLIDCTKNNLHDHTNPNGNHIDSCYDNLEAPIPIRLEFGQGAVLTSLVGYGFGYNTVDDTRNPSRGIIADFRQDFAGIGGDVNFIRSTGDFRHFTEILPDVVGQLHLQAGNLSAWGGHDLRMLDHFQLGPTLVRGFEPTGLGPRDPKTLGSLGGTNYWGASYEVQYPLFFLPREIGVKVAAFADVGSLWGYKGPTFYPPSGETLHPQDDNIVRSSVGAGLVWASPFGPLRIDYAVALSKASYDRTQEISFGAGGKF